MGWRTMLGLPPKVPSEADIALRRELDQLRQQRETAIREAKEKGHEMVDAFMRRVISRNDTGGTVQ